MSKHQFFPQNEDTESLVDIQLLPFGKLPNELSIGSDKIRGILRLITSRGIMRLEKTELWEGLVYEQIHSEFIPGLGSTRQYFHLFEPINGTMFAKVVKFLKEMYDEHKSESEAMLLFKPGTEDEPSKWAFYVPNQVVSHGSVNYTNDPEELKTFYSEGFMDIGTIHSHADFSAFHSGTDISDEENASSGIHITIGNLNDKNNHYSIVMSGVVNGRRLQFCHLDKFIENIKLVAKHEDVCPIFTFIDPQTFNEFTTPDEDKAKVKEISFRKSHAGAMGFDTGNDRKWGLGYNYSRENQNTHKLATSISRNAEIYTEDKDLVPMQDVNGIEIPKNIRKAIANAYTIPERAFFSLISIDEINLALEQKLTIVEILNLVLDCDFGKKAIETQNAITKEESSTTPKPEEEDPNVTAAC